MKPNYNDGDLILFEKNFSNLKRGDLITFLFPKDRSKWYFKGVIGLPGEAVEIKEGKILIDGQSLEEQYVDARFNQQKQNFPWRKIETEAYSSSATTAIIPPTRAIGERLTPS